MKKRIALFFILISSTAYAGGVDYGLIQNLPNAYSQGQEQAERIKQMQLQNQMMQMNLERQNRGRQESDKADKAFQDGYDAGYKQGFDTAMVFNQMTIEELRVMRENITEKYSPQSAKYQELIPLIDWRIGQIEKIKNTSVSPK